MSNALVPSSTTLALFAKPSRLSVRQRKRWLEILTSLDAKNVYVVYDESGSPVLEVKEQGSGIGSFFKRVFLGAFRPFTAHVQDLSGQRHAMEIKRPFRFIFHRIDVFDDQGTKIGAIQRRWAWVRRKYDVENANGEVIAHLFGPILRPWTFEVQLPGSTEEMGLVQKKWSGLLKEAFTEADNFWVEMDRLPDPQLRSLLFAATVLIDIVHFERSGY